MFKRLLSKIRRSVSQHAENKVYKLAAKGTPVGTALFSYLPEPIFYSEEDERLQYHSAPYASRTIAHIFSEMGYEVHAIRYDNQAFVPQQAYDIVFDIHSNIARWQPYFTEHTLTFMHITGSNPYYSLHAEHTRVQAMNLRRQAMYVPKRVVPHMEAFLYSVMTSDVCTIIGNQHTIDTYPKSLRHKMNMIRVSPSPLADNIKQRDQLIPSEREFLWFFGFGAVHKGLDLVLEVFAKNPQWTLHVVGSVTEESDFMQIYEQELLHTPNIHLHGQMKPSSEAFGQIIRRCVAFVAPTCSEGTSPSVITCMSIGLFP